MDSHELRRFADALLVCGGRHVGGGGPVYTQVAMHTMHHGQPYPNEFDWGTVKKTLEGWLEQEPGSTELKKLIRKCRRVLDMDAPATHELLSLVDASAKFRTWKHQLFLALAVKRDAGKYDPRRAPRAFVDLINDTAKAWCEASSGAMKWFREFSAEVRYDARCELVGEFNDWYRETYTPRSAK